MNRTHRLGQHLLVDSKTLSRIVAAAKIEPNETVCEVGAGSGVLTAELCRLARTVISFELDARMFAIASQNLKFDNLNLINSDAFKTFPPSFDVFVSNLPYSRSKDAIEWLVSAIPFRAAIVMVQKEFAEKILARPNERQYRSISALADFCFKIEQLFQVPRQAFLPQPRVDSVVLGFTPIRSVSQEIVKRLNLLFSYRNKKASSLSKRFGSVIDSSIAEKRIFQLQPDELVHIAELI